MVFNPLFLNILSNTGSAETLKLNKLSGQQYLFSDIIKVYSNRADTNFSLPEGSTEGKTLSDIISPVALDDQNNSEADILVNELIEKSTTFSSGEKIISVSDILNFLTKLEPIVSKDNINDQSSLADIKILEEALNSEKHPYGGLITINAGNSIYQLKIVPIASGSSAFQEELNNLEAVEMPLITGNEGQQSLLINEAIKTGSLPYSVSKKQNLTLTVSSNSSPEIGISQTQVPLENKSLGGQFNNYEEQLTSSDKENQNPFTPVEAKNILNSEVSTKAIADNPGKPIDLQIKTESQSFEVIKSGKHVAAEFQAEELKNVKSPSSSLEKNTISEKYADGNEKYHPQNGKANFAFEPWLDKDFTNSADYKSLESAVKNILVKESINNEPKLSGDNSQIPAKLSSINKSFGLTISAGSPHRNETSDDNITASLVFKLDGKGSAYGEKNLALQIIKTDKLPAIKNIPAEMVSLSQKPQLITGSKTNVSKSVISSKNNFNVNEVIKFVNMPAKHIQQELTDHDEHITHSVEKKVQMTNARISMQPDHSYSEQSKVNTSIKYTAGAASIFNKFSSQIKYSISEPVKTVSDSAKVISDVTKVISGTDEVVNSDSLQIKNEKSEALKSGLNIQNKTSEELPGKVIINKDFTHAAVEESLSGKVVNNETHHPSLEKQELSIAGTTLKNSDSEPVKDAQTKVTSDSKPREESTRTGADSNGKTESVESNSLTAKENTIQTRFVQKGFIDAQTNTNRPDASELNADSKNSAVIAERTVIADSNGRLQNQTVESAAVNELSGAEAAVNQDSLNNELTSNKESIGFAYNNEISTPKTSSEKIPFASYLSDFKYVKPAEVISEISRFIQQGDKSSMILKLTPEHLGKVKVVLEVIENTANANIEVESESVRQVVHNNVEILKQNLINSGITVAAVNINLSAQDQKTAHTYGPKKKFNSTGSDEKIDKKKVIDSNRKAMGYNTYEYVA